MKDQSTSPQAHSEDCNTPSEISIYSSNSNSLILSFYIHDGKIEGKTLKELSVMKSEDFSSFWKENYITMFFPSIDQENPPYSQGDSIELKNNKEKYINELHKLIDLIEHKNDNINSILDFLESIEDYEYLYKLKKEKKCLEDCEEGFRYYNSMNFENSRECYMRALDYAATNKQRYKCNFNLGNCYLVMNDIENAITHYVVSLDYASTNAEKYNTYYYLAECYKGTENEIECLKSALINATANEQKYNCCERIAGIYYHSNEIKTGNDYHLSSLQYATTKEQIFSTNMALGSGCNVMRRIEDSIFYFKAAVDNAEDDIQLFTSNMSVGKNYLVLGKFEEAMEYLLCGCEYAKTEDQKNKYHSYMCECLLGLDLTDEAVEEYNRGMEEATNFSNRFNLTEKFAILYSQKKDFESAIKYHSLALRYAYSYEEKCLCYNALGICYNMNKQFDKARRCFELVYPFLQSNLDRCVFHIQMSQSLFRLGKKGEAIDHYHKALKLSGSDYERFSCNEIIGQCFYDDKDYSEAKRYFAEANKYIYSVEDESRVNRFKEVFNIVNNM